MIRMEFDIGPIWRCAYEMLELANYKRDTVECVFNGFTLRAEPGMSKDDVVRPFWEESARREKRVQNLAILRDAVVEAAMVAASAPAIIRDPNGYLDRMKALRDAVDAYQAAKEIP